MNMNTAMGGGCRDAEEFARGLFLEDREFSVSTAIQLIRENCGRTLSEQEVEGIRSRVINRIEGAIPVEKWRETRKATTPGFTNRPRLVVTPKQETGGVVVARKGRPQVDVQEKREWLDGWLSTQPRIPTIKEAQAALREHFGEALGTTFVAQKLTEVHNRFVEERRRQLNAQQATVAPVLAPVPVTAPVVAPLRDIVKIIADLMKVNGIRKIAIDDEGRPTFEAFVA